MIDAERIFKVGSRNVHVRVRIYATNYGVERALQKPYHGLCIDHENGSFTMTMSRKAAENGISDHEMQHLIDWSGIKQREKRAELAQQVGPWIRSLIQ